MFFCFLHGSCTPSCSDDTSFRRTLFRNSQRHHPFFFSDRHYSHLVRFRFSHRAAFRFFIFPWEVAGSFHEGNGISRCASCARVCRYVRLCASCDPRVPHGNSCRDRCPSGTGEDGAQSSGSGSGGDALVEPLFPF